MQLLRDQDNSLLSADGRWPWLLANEPEAERTAASRQPAIRSPPTIANRDVAPSQLAPKRPRNSARKSSLGSALEDDGVSALADSCGTTLCIFSRTPRSMNRDN
jgi:hypothetical protein